MKRNSHPSNFRGRPYCRRLLFCLATISANALAEGQDSEFQESREGKPCHTVPMTSSGQAAAESTSALESCEVANEEISAEATQEMTTSITEGTQTAHSLRTLLLGRNYVFFGRIEGEAAAYRGDISSQDNGVDLRRLRVGITGLATFLDTVSYKAEFDLTDGTNNFSDLYIQWDPANWGSFRFGNQRVSQNLSAMTSSLSQVFMEDPLPVSAFSLSRRLAIGYDEDWRRFGLHGMIFTRDPNNDAGKHGLALRAFTKPIHGFGRLGHVGVSLVSEKMDREARYRARPESHITDEMLVDSGRYEDVQYQHVAGIEFAGGAGPNTLRFELFRSRWERDKGLHNSFSGAYLELGRFLTGQDFNYQGGKVVRPVMSSGTRAWELGLRASWVDLNDKDVRGGEQVNLGAALNYYRRPDLRFQLNLLHFRTDAVAGDKKGWILQGRLQYNR